MIDVQSLFNQAESAFRRGDAPRALSLLHRVLAATGKHATVLHLRALTLQQLGQPTLAVTDFIAARRMEPNDPRLANDLGNLFDQLGRLREAAHAYDDAVRLAPGDANMRINRALARQKNGDLAGSKSDLEQAIALSPQSPRAWVAVGSLMRAIGDLAAAAHAYDQALLYQPDNAVAAHGRARISFERGEIDAAARYRSCLQRAPDDQQLIIGLAEALDANGNPEGRESLASAVSRNPDWIDGHNLLARMRAEAGEPIDGSFVAAEQASPGNLALRQAHWQTLVRANDHARALDIISAARPWTAGRPDVLLEEAAIASEAGDIDRATAALSRLPADDDDARLVRGRLALRRGDPEAAATLLEQVTTNQPDLVTAWAHLGLAWRLIGDVRAEWLCEQPGLTRSIDLPLSSASLARLTQILRNLHQSRAQPIGQSLRGGTQTRGRLFDRIEPEIREARDQIQVAIDTHVSMLPPFDAGHPLLKYRRRRFKFDGSWSVLLGAQGRHINHIHPQGTLSSACYIALPQGDAIDPKAGWLEIGRPPDELGLSLEPIQTIEPLPGRLALFPSYMFHGTRPFSNGERLTMAFDAVPR